METLFVGFYLTKNPRDLFIHSQGWEESTWTDGSLIFSGRFWVGESQGRQGDQRRPVGEENSFRARGPSGGQAPGANFLEIDEWS